MMIRQLTYAQAISESIVQAMDLDPNVFLIGLGVDDHKGIFNTTIEAYRRFGARRVLGTPASENALTGVAIGAALNGKRPILVHARNDFMFLALDQMINNAAKWKFTSGGISTVPIVVRAIIGKGWGQGPVHSQSIQSVLAHFPGLYVAMPSNAYDAKGILQKSLQVETPVVILEHRALYDQSADVPANRYTVEFGQGKVVRPGKDLTVVAASMMVSEALKAATILEEEGIDIEIIDPVTIQPLDEKTIIDSIKKTGRMICADTSWARCGFSAEVAAVAAEKAFRYLKTPVKRITLPAYPSPVSKVLEDAFYPMSQDIRKAVYEVLDIKKKNSPDSFKEADTFMGPY